MECRGGEWIQSVEVESGGEGIPHSPDSNDGEVSFMHQIGE